MKEVFSRQRLYEIAAEVNRKKEAEKAYCIAGVIEYVDNETAIWVERIKLAMSAAAHNGFMFLQITVPNHQELITRLLAYFREYRAKVGTWNGTIINFYVDWQRSQDSERANSKGTSAT